jgi:hypothetical protein
VSPDFICLSSLLHQVVSGNVALLADDDNYGLILRVLAHWGCPDPELKFLSPPVFKVVQRIIDADGRFSQHDLPPIALYADGLHSLIIYDARVNPHLAEEGKLSSEMVSLLKASLRIAQSSLQSKSFVEGKPVTQPFDRKSHFRSDFEEMVKTGIFAPTHPVMRTFPYFRQDYLSSMSSTRRRNKQSQERDEALHLLRVQSERMGATCNKYKTRQRALTPGLFTVFCGSCGVCEAVELMPVFESPVTAFRMFAHRAWRADDYDVIAQYEMHSIWADCM